MGAVIVSTKSMMDTIADVGRRKAKHGGGERRRRTWSAGQRQRIIAESFAPGASVAEVARRYGLNANMLFTWRRREQQASGASAVGCPSSDDLRQFACFQKGGSGSSVIRLCGMQLMLQTTIGDGLAFDPFAFEEDGLGPSEVDVSRSEIAEALVIAGMVVMRHEGRDLAFEIAGQVVMLEQDAVLERLMPALDLALGLWVIRALRGRAPCSADPATPRDPS